MPRPTAEPHQRIVPRSYVTMASLGPDDVIVRGVVEGLERKYAVGTLSAPDQFRVSTRHEAVAAALAFATEHRVGAWLAVAVDAFISLGPLSRRYVH